MSASRDAAASAGSRWTCASGWPPGDRPTLTSLRYDAHATVGGFVARLGNATLTVVGGHLTGAFFRDLDGSLRRARTQRVASLV